MPFIRPASPRRQRGVPHVQDPRQEHACGAARNRYAHDHPLLAMSRRHRGMAGDRFEEMPDQLLPPRTAGMPIHPAATAPIARLTSGTVIARGDS